MENNKKNTPKKVQRISIFMYAFIACVIIGLSASLCLFGLSYFSAANIEKQRNNEISQATGKMLSGRFNHFIDRIRQQVNYLAKDNPDFFKGLESYHAAADPAQQQALLAQLQAANSTYISHVLPNAQDIRILPYSASGTAGLKRLNIALNNNIELSLFSKAAVNKQQTAEVYKVNDLWRVTFAAPITRESKTLGVLLVSFDSDLFDSILKAAGNTISRVKLATEKNQVIYQTSSLPIKSDWIFPSPIPQTKLQVAFKKNLTAPVNLRLLYTGVLFLALIAALCCIFIALILNRKLKEDAESLAQYIKAKLGLHSARRPMLQLTALETVLNAITRLDGSIMKSAVNESQSNTGTMSDNTVTHEPEPIIPVATVEAKAPETAFPHEIFRDYDIRGHGSEQLSPALSEDIGRAIATEALNVKQSTLVVGADCRLTSPALKQALIKGLLEGGCDVIDIGVVASPLLYFATHHLNTQAGVIVTASHNPGHDNGYKIILDGKSLTGSFIQKLKMRIKNQDFSEGQGTLTSTTIESAYINEFKGDIIVARPLKVVLDAGNGVGGPLAKALLESLDCEVTALFCNMDGNFPNHDPDPCDIRNLDALIKEVHAQQADMGIALDGDADRMVAVTDQGKMLTGDQLLMLFAVDIAASNPGCNVVYDVKCSQFLAKIISESGGRPIIWKTGHSNIKQKMAETGALLGGEYTGHFCFKDRWFGFDDGIYAAARMIELLSMGHLSLHEKYLALPSSFSTDEIYLELATEQEKFSIIDKLGATFQDTEAELVAIDGVRLEYPDSWGLVRASNTSSKLTARFEADSKEALINIQQVFQTALTHVDPKLVLPIKD